MTTGVARELEPFTKIFDCLASVSAATAKKLAARGFGACGRYLEDLTVGERDDIWGAGLPILLYTEACIENLTHVLGVQMGELDLDRCDRLDVADGVHLVCDLESAHGNASDVAGYVEARADTWMTGKKLGACYLGADQPLGGGAVYALQSVHGYIRGGSLGIPEPACGFFAWQIPPLDQTIEGQRIDAGMSGRDARGRAPILWWPS